MIGGWTQASLERAKRALASLLSLAVFAGFSAGAPVVADPELNWVSAGHHSPSHADDLASRAETLVHQGRWSDVVSICEVAARKGVLAPSLRQQYDLAKLHCDIARRHAEPAFRRQLTTLSESDARRVYAEVLSRIASHHVDAPDFNLALEAQLKSATPSVAGSSA